MPKIKIVLRTFNFQKVVGYIQKVGGRKSGMWGQGPAHYAKKKSFEDRLGSF